MELTLKKVLLALNGDVLDWFGVDVAPMPNAPNGDAPGVDCGLCMGGALGVNWGLNGGGGAFGVNCGLVGGGRALGVEGGGGGCGAAGALKVGWDGLLRLLEVAALLPPFSSSLEDAELPVGGSSRLACFFFLNLSPLSSGSNRNPLGWISRGFRASAICILIRT